MSEKVSPKADPIPALIRVKELITKREGEIFVWDLTNLSRAIGYDVKNTRFLIQGKKKWIFRETYDRIMELPRLNEIKKPKKVISAYNVRQRLLLLTGVKNGRKDGDYWSAQEIANALEISKIHVNRIMQEHKEGSQDYTKIDPVLAHKIMALPTRGQVINLASYPEAAAHANWLYNKWKGGWKKEELAEYLDIPVCRLTLFARGKSKIPKTLAQKIMGTPSRKAFLQIQENKAKRFGKVA